MIIVRKEVEHMEKWSVEYSVEQGCFHVDILENALQSNLESVIENHQTQYCIIGVFDSREECRTFIDRLTKAHHIPNYHR